MTAEQVIRRVRDLPIRETVGPVASALAGEQVLVGIIDFTRRASGLVVTIDRHGKKASYEPDCRK